MLIDTLLLSLVIGLLRRGSLRALAQMELRYAGWMVAAFALQWGLYALALRNVEWAIKAGPLSFVVSLAVLTVTCFANRALFPEMAIVGLGVAANLLVVAANGGQMPVAEPALYAAGLSHLQGMLEDPRVFTHTPLVEGSSRLWFLADIFALPRPYPRPKAFSLGDLLVAVGVFLLVQRGLGRPLLPQLGRSRSTGRSL